MNIPRTERQSISRNLYFYRYIISKSKKKKRFNIFLNNNNNNNENISNHKRNVKYSIWIEYRNKLLKQRKAKRSQYVNEEKKNNKE